DPITFEILHALERARALLVDAPQPVAKALEGDRIDAHLRPGCRPRRLGRRRLHRHTSLLTRPPSRPRRRPSASARAGTRPEPRRSRAGAAPRTGRAGAPRDAAPRRSGGPAR